MTTKILLTLSVIIMCINLALIGAGIFIYIRVSQAIATIAIPESDSQIQTNVHVVTKLSVPIKTNVPIHTSVSVPVEIPIIGQAVRVTVPINTTVPIDTTVTIPIDTTVPVKIHTADIPALASILQLLKSFSFK